MKSRFAREMSLLLLPVLLLGAFGWWKTRGGDLTHFGLQDPLSTGKVRIEYEPFQVEPLTALEAAQGYDWKVRTQIKTVGRLNVPPALVLWIQLNRRRQIQIRIDYRRGKKWRRAPIGPKTMSVTTDATKSAQILRFHLDAVPPDAEEVRLRGRFTQTQIYQGTPPAGWVMPPGMFRSGADFKYPIQSKPFDIEIGRYLSGTTKTSIGKK
jgi:hypothetical protein